MKDIEKQCILYMILESIFRDLKFNIKDIYLNKENLRFSLNNQQINIEIDKDNYILTVRKEEWLSGKVNENMLEECLTKLCIIFSYESTREFNNYDVFFKFVQLSWFFNLSYNIYNTQMIIKSPDSEKQMLITEVEENIYHLSLGEDEYYLPISQQPKELFNTDFEYNVNLNKYSKFYDKDKTVQFVGYLSKLITKE